MPPVEQVFDYRFPNVDYAIVTVSRRLAELAAGHGWTVETWDEDGLGEASGVLLRLASGRIILVMELRHAIEYHGEAGPTAFIDGSELATHGVAALLAEILAALGLTEQDTTWTAPAENQQAAADFLTRLPRALPPPPSLGPPDSYIHVINPPDEGFEIECYGEPTAIAIRCGGSGNIAAAFSRPAAMPTETGATRCPRARFRPSPRSMPSADLLRARFQPPSSRRCGARRWVSSDRRQPRSRLHGVSGADLNCSASTSLNFPLHRRSCRPRPSRLCDEAAARYEATRRTDPISPAIQLRAPRAAPRRN